MDNKKEGAQVPTPVRIVASTSTALEYHYQPVAMSAHAISTKAYEVAATVPPTGAKTEK